MLSTLSLTLALMATTSQSMDSYLLRAIERGAPLFNDGNPEACAAVYATALEGVATNGGWGMEEAQRANLADWLELTAVIDDPIQRAWAYRGVIDDILEGKSVEAPKLAASLPLFDFADPGELERWRVVVDGVMGGRSTGSLRIEDERLIFTGETSLRNNGGFSSIRAAVPAGSLAGYSALRIRVRGDGRTYILGASSRSGRGDSYWTPFDTEADTWVTVTVPVTDMVRQYFGTPIQGRLRPASVAGVEFYIYDKQEGPFRLEVAQIEAVR
ncbi:MAG: CIA30 family protein [Xanthomonadales bacterium]|jgi:monofunctional biosynthetic peptidoglycan transglycosylase|nr:CIA30 family protein [Xanthomonadales bacterium]